MPIALLLAAALVAPATVFAAGGTGKETGYSQTAPPPTTPTTTPTTPLKEKSTATKEVAPSTTSSSSSSTPPTSTTPTSTTAPETAKARTLPFTGLDLRLIVGVGLLLILAGVSIVAVQRRQRHDTGLSRRWQR